MAATVSIANIVDPSNQIPFKFPCPNHPCQSFRPTNSTNKCQLPFTVSKYAPLYVRLSLMYTWKMNSPNTRICPSIIKLRFSNKAITYSRSVPSNFSTNAQAPYTPMIHLHHTSNEFREESTRSLKLLSTLWVKRLTADCTISHLDSIKHRVLFKGFY